MDAAEYQRIADQLGACDVERDHELACARSDGYSDPYEAAAAALTAARALPERHLEPVRFAHHAWGPGDVVPDHWGTTKADEWMSWYEQATAHSRA